MTPKTKKSLEGRAALDLAQKSTTFILDVRTPQEFQSGALEKAVLIPVDQVEARIDELPEDKDAEILVYCAHGIRSLYAQEILERCGHTQVYNLTGGLAALFHWLEKN